mgnify:CR=1 FL=1
MFNPSRDDVRRFFCEAWRRGRAGEPLTPLQAMALKWIERHPETHALLTDAQAALDSDFSLDRGDSNPFLHLSLHLAIDEQLSIDQPPGLRALFARLAARAASEHDAAHEVMECLGRVLWESQRGALPADPAAINEAYLECLRRRAGG